MNSHFGPRAPPERRAARLHVPGTRTVCAGYSPSTVSRPLRSSTTIFARRLPQRRRWRPDRLCGRLRFAPRAARAIAPTQIARSDAISSDAVYPSRTYGKRSAWLISTSRGRCSPCRFSPPRNAHRLDRRRLCARRSKPPPVSLFIGLALTYARSGPRLLSYGTVWRRHRAFARQSAPIARRLGGRTRRCFHPDNVSERTCRASDFHVLPNHHP
jgi:hypothetical protein